MGQCNFIFLGDLINFLVSVLRMYPIPHNINANWRKLKIDKKSLCLETDEGIGISVFSEIIATNCDLDDQ